MSISERYTRATVSKNLRLEEHVCDADKLIAAGWAVSGNRHLELVLSMQRWMSGDMRGMNQVVERMAGWLTGFTARNRRVLTVPSRSEALDLARAVCAWWMNQACPECSGHGHPLIAGAPVLDTSRDCPACSGTGRRELTTGMTEQQAYLAQWLAGQIEAVAPLVFGQMARRLRNDMNF